VAFCCASLAAADLLSPAPGHQGYLSSFGNILASYLAPVNALALALVRRPFIRANAS
jgi:hypothetical protein